MHKLIIVFVLYLLLIPFNAEETVVQNLAAPEKTATSNLLASPNPVEQNVQTSSSLIPVSLEKEKSFKEDTNPVSLDPQDLPAIIDNNNPKEENPAQVSINQKDIISIVDKNQTREKRPGPVTMNPDDFFKIVDKNEPRGAGPSGVQMDPNDFFKIVDSPEPPKPIPTEAPPAILTSADAPKEKIAYPAAVIEQDLFKIVDKNEPKDTNPVGVDIPALIPAQLIDKNEAKEIDPIKTNTSPTGDDPKAPLLDPDSYEPDDTAATFRTISVGSSLTTQARTLHTSTDQIG